MTLAKMRLLQAIFPAMALALAGSFPGGPVQAQSDLSRATVTLFDHRFQPSEVSVPAGRTFVLIVKNQDRMAEQFASKALGVEQLIAGSQQIELRLGPLTPGTYPFAGQYHPESAQGQLVAK